MKVAHRQRTVIVSAAWGGKVCPILKQVKRCGYGKHSRLASGGAAIAAAPSSSDTNVHIDDNGRGGASAAAAYMASVEQRVKVEALRKKANAEAEAAARYLTLYVVPCTNGTSIVHACTQRYSPRIC